MSFIVVNTGRAASRAFYLNLKRQQGVVTLSRKELDRALRDAVDHQRSDALRALTDAYRLGCSARAGAIAGLVLHGARRALLTPYDHPNNVKTLARLRDELDIGTVFFVVRDPRTMILSELNRMLAKRVGDWSFDRTAGSWRDVFSLADLAHLQREPPTPLGPIVNVPAPDADQLRAMIQDAGERSGRIFESATQIASPISQAG